MLPVRGTIGNYSPCGPIFAFHRLLHVITDVNPSGVALFYDVDTRSLQEMFYPF